VPRPLALLCAILVVVGVLPAAGVAEPSGVSPATRPTVDTPGSAPPGPAAVATDAPSNGTNRTVPTREWSASTGDWSLYNPPPVVVDDRLYVPVQDGIAAVNRTTGAVVWRFENPLDEQRGGLDTEDEGAVRPVVANGTVFLAVNARGDPVNLRVFALDADTGTVEWEWNATYIERGYPDLTAPPVVSNGTLYVSDDGRSLFALEAETGRERWSTSLGTSGRFVLAAGLVVTTFPQTAATRSASAFDADTGDRRWYLPTNHSISLPYRSGDSVVLVADGRLRALDPRTGDERWNTPIRGERVVPAATHDGTVYLLAGDTLHGEWNETRAVAVDAADGDVRWNRSVGRAVEDGLRVGGGIAAVLRRDGTVLVLDGADGDHRWQAVVDSRTGADGPDASRVAPSRSRVLVEGRTALVARSPANGSVLWQTARDGRPAKHAADGSRVYLATHNGTLTALRDRVRPGDRPLPGTGATAGPTDLDGDGVYEDVDGDGRTTFADAIALAFVDAGTLSGPERRALDVDGDGDVDFGDAIELAFP
jgi:outer membrane protein assembly factor BamB